MSFQSINGREEFHRTERIDLRYEAEPTMRACDMQRFNHVRFGALHMTRGMEGDPEAWQHGCEHLHRAEELANTPRTKEEWKQAITGIITREKLSALKTPPANLTLRQGGDANVRIDGLMYTEGGSDEVRRLRDIKMRFSNTLLAVEDKPFQRSVGSYLEPYEKAFNVDRSKLEEDLRWLVDTKRIGNNVPLERRQVFEAYASMIRELIMLNDPKSEREFVGKYKSVVGARNCLEHYCRDPESAKGAGRFALLLAMGALLALWGIKDFRNKSISLATLIFLGGVLYLMRTGSKFDFLGEQSFARLTQNGRLDKQNIQNLQALAKGKPSVYGHLYSTIEGLLLADATREGPISEDIVTKLTKPMRQSQGRETVDQRKAVPEDIARLFIGMRPGDVAQVLRGIRDTARNRDSRIVAEFAEANRSGNVRADLEELRTVPTAMLTFEPVTEEEMRRAAEQQTERQRATEEARRRNPPAAAAPTPTPTPPSA